MKTKMGKILIISGVILLIVGILITLFPKSSGLGRLPGDIAIERENFKFYIPITTSVLISLVITIILFVINKLR